MSKIFLMTGNQYLIIIIGQVQNILLQIVSVRLKVSTKPTWRSQIASLGSSFLSILRKDQQTQSLLFWTTLSSIRHIHVPPTYNINNTSMLLTFLQSCRYICLTPCSLPLSGAHNCIFQPNNAKVSS